MSGDMKEILNSLGDAPTGIAEPDVAAECKAMAENGYTAAEVKSLLDRIVYSALAADAFVIALDVVWKDALERENEGRGSDSPV